MTDSQRNEGERLAKTWTAELKANQALKKGKDARGICRHHGVELAKAVGDRASVEADTWLGSGLIDQSVLRSGGPKVSFRFNVEPNERMDTS
jgi:hypothetical protein